MSGHHSSDQPHGYTGGAAQPVERLFADVVEIGLCARCGTCVAVCPVGCLRPTQDHAPRYEGGCSACGACVESCPGRDLPMGDLERGVFGKERSGAGELGAYRAVRAGFALDPEVRRAGTSGGVVTALLLGLLQAGTITGAVVTGFEADEPYRAAALIARDEAALRASAQSKYSITPQVSVLRDADEGDRLAFVGLPCQIAGLRKAWAAGHGPSTIVVTIGLFCLSGFYPEATEFIIRHVLGLGLESVRRVAYRDGPFPGAFTVTTRAGETHVVPYADARAYLRMYRPYRCITCFDWSAELADISVGDLFGDPERDAYSSVLVRSGLGERVLGDAVQAGRVHLEDNEPEAVTRNPGYLYKKHGNRLFMIDARAHGLPTPTYP